MNARNEAGLTPLDILLLINNEAGDAEIAKILTRLGATRARGLPSVVVATEDPEPPTALLVVAALITTATYQAVLQLPGGLWLDDSGSSSSSTSAVNNRNPSHNAGQVTLGTKNLVLYILFLILNSFGFFASIRMIYILTLGFPIQMELQVALFTLITTLRWAPSRPTLSSTTSSSVSRYCCRS